MAKKDRDLIRIQIAFCVLIGVSENAIISYDAKMEASNQKW